MIKNIEKDYALMSGANLAYLGDSYYELQIRKYLLEMGITKSKELKNMSVNYVSAHAHQNICNQLLSEFTAEEINIFKRGRNSAPKSHRKNLDPAEYVNSTGFEAVIGYLYLKQDFARLDYLINRAIMIIRGE